MNKKQKWISTALFSWGVLFLVCGLVMTTLTACSNDDETGNGVDDLAFLQKRIAKEGDLVYGVQVGDNTKDILSRPIQTEADGLNEFYKLIPDGKNHKGLTSGNNGTISCKLTDAKGNYQGTIVYAPTSNYYSSAVTFGTEIVQATQITQLRYILYNRWPEEENGFLKDILDRLKD
jgi:hypothetical protein